MDIYLFLPELIQKNYLNFILIFNSVGKCDLRDVWQVRRDNRQKSSIYFLQMKGKVFEIEPLNDYN